MIEINGKEYPLWSKFVERKAEWIGGVLEDFGDNDPILGSFHGVTEIVDICLEPNGDDSAFFRVAGKEFDCGFDVQVGGVLGKDTGPGWINFSGYGGHTWRIKKKE